MKIINKINLIKIRKIIIKQEKNKLSEIEKIHKIGRITPDEKALEWERAGICAPLECMGRNKSILRCDKYSNDCHQCLKDFASRKESYEPFLNDFEFLPNLNLLEETKKVEEEYNNKNLVKTKKR